MSPRLKVSQACSNCRRRKIKCDSEYPTCGPCVERQEHDCMYTRVQSLSRTRPILPRTQIMRGTMKDPTVPSASVGTAHSNRRVAGRPRPPGSFWDRVDDHVAPLTSDVLPAKTVHASSYSDGTVAATSNNVNSTTLNTDTPPNTDFFGRSSSRIFLKEINKAIDARLGRSITGTDLAEDSLSAESQAAQADKDSCLDPENMQCYELPARKFADNLLQAYYDLVWAVYPIHDRSSFQQAYNSAWLGSPSSFPQKILYCFMNLVFALGSQFSEIIEPQSRKEVGHSYWIRASKLFGDATTASPSLERVQCLLLMGFYLHSTCEIHQSWMLVGCAVRMAQSLGLHVLPIEDSVTRRTEMARRVWHGCVYQDRVLAMTLGRPSMITCGLPDPVPLPVMIDDEFLDVQTHPNILRPDGKTAIVAVFIKSLELFDIVNDIQYEVHQQQKQKRQGDVTLPTSLIELDNRLLQWSSSLPVQLRYEVTNKVDDLVPTRQRVVLRARFLFARMSALRSVLADFGHWQAGSAGGQLSSDRALYQTVVSECGELCFDLAREMIEVIYSSFNFDTISGPVPAWWFGVLFIYTAATILLVERVWPQTGRRNQSVDGSTWDKALQLLKAYSRVSQSAQRCIAALEILSDKVQDTINSLSSQGGGEVAPLPEEAREMPTPASPRTSMMEDQQYSLNFSNFEFMEDMSWLSAPPTDFLFLNVDMDDTNNSL